MTTNNIGKKDGGLLSGVGIHYEIYKKSISGYSYFVCRVGIDKFPGPLNSYHNVSFIIVSH